MHIRRQYDLCTAESHPIHIFPLTEKSLFCWCFFKLYFSVYRAGFIISYVCDYDFQLFFMVWATCSPEHMGLSLFPTLFMQANATLFPKSMKLY